MRFTSIIVFSWLAYHPLFAQPRNPATVECTPLSALGYENRNAKINIRESGRYCLTNDLHARLDFADHPAEGRQIHIWASNVDLDLQGHTIGRGRIYVQQGGIGIELEQNSRNVKISNGTIENFTVGVYRTGYEQEKKETVLNPDIKNNLIVFKQDQIILNNIIFKNCGTNFIIRGWEDF